ncbi:hypothetical protein PHYBOEH_009798 [Phytophthora boehmeriae]|uniref:Uncharacterized protein n=1 Tax=Phytophthora boehmeriae TaxID=109152 RepID=A0A8T1VQX8_9STRA|nr:hypothetical protein PHYBOEH_009798 [Phytophthora boehmeriae]
MRQQRGGTGLTATQMALASTGDSATDALDIVFDVCVCLLALLFSAALMKLLRDYTRRKGYIEIQQDDQGMYSNVLIGTTDSWENVLVVDKATDGAAI